MNKSVIQTLISRIDIYARNANVNEQIIINQYKKNINNLSKNDDSFNTLEVLRNLRLLSLKMGNKRTTILMYLERDIEFLKEMLNEHIKNSGRNFVETMKENKEKVLVKTKLMIN